MTVKNTGGVNQPPLAQMEKYEWTIPTGWKQETTGNTGTTYTTSPTIRVVPNNINGICAGDGDLKVRAVASGFTSCTGYYSKSNQSTIQLRRTPTFNLTPPAGYTGQTCGKGASVTFTATSVSCVSSYAWTYPANWSGPATTTNNSVTATPGNNGGVITVEANTGGCKIKKTYTIPYTSVVPSPSVYITNPYTEWCNNDPFTFTATPAPGYPTNFGFDWYATGGISINNVTNSTSTAPTHTTGNSVPVLVGGSVYGTQSVAVRMSNPACPPSAYAGFQRKVGPYSNSEFSIIGPSMVCPNQAADFRPNFITSDVWGYEWSAPSGWSSSGQGTPYFSVSVPYDFTGGAITLRLQNRCGWTNTPYVLFLNSGFCFSFSASPNPVSETLTISDLDPEQETTATLIDGNNKSQRTVSGKANKLELDVKGLPNGLYILQLTQKNVTETEQILIKN
jgi:hypothetical protein